MHSHDRLRDNHFCHVWIARCRAMPLPAGWRPGASAAHCCMTPCPQGPSQPGPGRAAAGRLGVWRARPAARPFARPSAQTPGQGTGCGSAAAVGLRASASLQRISVWHQPHAESQRADCVIGSRLTSSVKKGLLSGDVGGQAYHSASADHSSRLQGSQQMEGSAQLPEARKRPRDLRSTCRSAPA